MGMNAIGTDSKLPMAIVVIGASGDLAGRKIVPALFSLYCQGQLPRDFCVFGLARTAMDHAAFRVRLAEHLTCRYSPAESCADRMSEFLGRCYYSAGQYGSPNAYLDLYAAMRELQGARANRLFYMAVPPGVFMDVSRALGDSGLVECGDDEPWSRAVIEKPFGRDRATSDQMVREMHEVFTEDTTYRIDHYLGKEVVQNLMVLRFANAIFEPLWNRRHVKSVRLTWREPGGVGQRGGYFDGFGIIRDVMQNHLLQILALLTMERPRELAANAVKDEKVRLLRCIPPLTVDDVVVGQYAAERDGRHAAYVAEPGVTASSRTPTYAAAMLRILDPRWEGVPFFVEAGKALDRAISEVRILFHDTASAFWSNGTGAVEPNELVIRIQPDEAIELKIMSKVPGLELSVRPTSLNLRYQDAFQTPIPDAYECLLLDVIGGDRSLFIRADELAAAWDIFTPVLHALDEGCVTPELYEFGGNGPESATRLAAKFGVERGGRL